MGEAERGDDPVKDDQIVALFFARSQQALTELDRKYGAVCSAVARNIPRNPQDAEECVNDAYLGVWNTIPPQHPNPLLTYLCRIVRNHAIKRYHANTAQKRDSSYDVALDELPRHLVQFCLGGAERKRVRFSCKNRELDYRDCTEQRNEYGQAQNFVVEYGSNTDEYPSLLIDWVPDKTIRALTDNEDMTIAKLPEDLREDVIVLEITYANDQTNTKALTVTLQDNGQFFAKFVNYKITDADTFVQRPDAKVVPRAELYGSGDAA